MTTPADAMLAYISSAQLVGWVCTIATPLAAAILAVRALRRGA